MAGAVILLTAAGYGLFRNLTPKVVSEKDILYSYTMAVDSGYKVSLVENELYPEKVLGEDRVYARSLIDHLSIKFTAEYIGSKTAAISGNYSAAVVVEGYQLVGDSRKVIYEKNFPLTENKVIKGADSVKIAEEVTVDINEYKAFADKADQILNAKPGREARVLFSGVILAKTEQGEINEPFMYSILLPLTNDLFSITKQAPITKADVIAETREIVMEPAAASFILPVTSLLIALAAIAALVFLTRPPTTEESYCSAFKGIMRKHGSRMVRLESLAAGPGDVQVTVADLDSLIKIADELQRPVCYALDEEGLPAAGLLYVPDGQRRYMLCLKR